MEEIIPISKAKNIVYHCHCISELQSWRSSVIDSTKGVKVNKDTQLLLRKIKRSIKAMQRGLHVHYGREQLSRQQLKLGVKVVRFNPTVHPEDMLDKIISIS